MTTAMMEMMPIISGGSPPSTSTLFERLVVDVVAGVVDAEFNDSNEKVLGTIPSLAKDYNKEFIENSAPSLHKLINMSIVAKDVKVMRCARTHSLVKHIVVMLWKGF
jgi:hypothetical protein